MCPWVEVHDSYVVGLVVHEATLVCCPDYNLVVICAKENEEMSRMVTVLDRYRVNQPLVYPTDKIKHYLKEHFIADQSVVQLDPER